MEIYNKSDKKSFTTYKSIKIDDYNKLNFITIITNQYDDELYCKIEIFLKNTFYDVNIINELMLINKNLIFDKNRIIFISKNFDKINTDLLITKFVINIINKLLEFEFIDLNSKFGLTYDYMDNLYAGCVLTSNII